MGGGFSNVFGHVAEGFENARQIDAQRQFEAEQAMRQQHLGLLSKMASDETIDPHLRQWAMQEGINGLQTQPGKKWVPNWKAMPPPPAGGGQQPTQQFTPNPMPAPPSGMGTTGPPLPQAPGAGTAQFTPPPTSEYYPGTSFKTHEALAQEAGMQVGTVAGAQATAQVDAFRKAFQQTMQEHPDWSPQMVYASMGKALPYSMVMGGMAGEKVPQTAGEARNDPEWSHLVPAQLQDSDTVFLQRTRDGRPMNVTGGILPSALPKTTSESSSTTTPGGMTTSRQQKRTVTPVLPGGNPMPQPPGQAAAPKSVPSQTSGKQVPPAVAAAETLIKMFGLPPGKPNDAESIALSNLQKQGYDPVPAGSPQAKGRADSARAVLPLIDKARQLIAANPGALGPIAGRWSELQQKAGSLSGPAKELAGTLTSIYSLAGSMHGWRALKVAEEFEKTYGTLSSNAASLNSGLDAMQNTAGVVQHIGYPGLNEMPPPPAKKQFYRIGGKAYDALTHQEIH